MATRRRRPGADKTARPRGDEVPASASAAIVDELAGLLRRHELAEVEVQRGDLYVRLVAGGAAHPSSASAAASPRAAAAAPSAKLETTTETSDGNISYITSPFVGTYYRAPNPDAAPFVDEGTKIKKGQVLCIVEAMKLMNEIEAE